MPVVKLSLTTEEFEILSEQAAGEKMTVQDFIRYRLLSKKNPEIFTPEEAQRRALEKFGVEDEPFTLPDVYGEEWEKLNPRMTGVFGKRFFNHVKDSGSIEFAGMTAGGRRATYRIKEEN